MVWYSHLLKNFPQFLVIHKVKGFSIVNEVDVFSGSHLLSPSLNKCWQFVFQFLSLFKIQLVHLEVLGSCTIKA